MVHQLFNFLVEFFTNYYLQFLVFYVIGGVLYAAAKWSLQIFKLKSRIDFKADEIAVQKNSSNSWKTQTDNAIIAYLRSYQAGLIFASSDYPPLVSKNKSSLFEWALFWPLNLLYTLFADVISESFSWVYRKFGGILQRISNSILPK